MLETSAARLEEQGVPSEFVLPLMETLEMLAIASAMYSRREDDLGGAKLTHHDHPTLVRAARNRDNAQEQLFEDACTAVIASIQGRIAASAGKRLRPAAGPAKRATPTTTTKRPAAAKRAVAAS